MPSHNQKETTAETAKADADHQPDHPARSTSKQPSHAFWEKLKLKLPWPRPFLPSKDKKSQKPNGEKPTTPPIPNDKNLTVRLINDDLKYITQGINNLEQYRRQLQEKQNEASKARHETEKMEYLEDLQKAIIKLKLKIPAMFRVDPDEIDPNKKLQLVFEAKQDLPKELEDIKPKVHKEDVFQSSVEFKDFEARYNELSSIEKKMCLLCFSIFPEDAIIKKRLMVQWWVCEGFANKDTAGEYFKELMRKGFIEPINENKSPRVKECRMHPFYRSALAMLADRAMFFNFKDDSGEPTQDFRGTCQACLVGDGVISYDELVEEYKAAEEAGKADLVEVLERTLERVHLIFNVKESKLEFKPKWFTMMKNVHFMHLGNWRNSDHVEVESTDFLKEAKEMNYVKFLSLQGVANIIKLPRSISKFANLEILDLRACHNLESLPDNIGELRSLIQLDMSECSLLDHMPKGLSKLKKLEVLKGFVVGQDRFIRSSSCTLHDLRDLEKLEKLCIYTGSAQFPTSKQVEDLAELKNLQKLTITWAVIEETPGLGDDAADKTHQQRTERRGDAGDDEPKLQKGAFSKLTKLDLKCFPASDASTRPNWLSFQNLGPLENLKKLYIRGGYFSDLGQYQDTDHLAPWKTTWKVTHLRLKYLSEMEMEWGELHELFPDLEFLEQVDCPKLTFFQCDANGLWKRK